MSYHLNYLTSCKILEQGAMPVPHSILFEVLGDRLRATYIKAEKQEDYDDVENRMVVLPWVVQEIVEIDDISERGRIRLIRMITARNPEAK